MLSAWPTLVALAAASAPAAVSDAAPKPDSSAGPALACAHADPLISDPADRPLVDLPFRTIDGRIYLDVAVNGRGPFVFALDTGASGIGRADASLVTGLALPPAGQSETSDGVTSAQVDTVRIDSLALGELERNQVSVIARDYRSRVAAYAAFDGILGREFFADGLLVIDFPAQRLRFYRSRALMPDQLGAMVYERAFRVPISLGALETTGNLDTGADVTLVIPEAVYDQLKAAPLQPAGNISLTNTRVASSTGRFAGPVVIGGARLTDVQVRVAQDYPEVLIGAHALKNQRVLIDQRHMTVAFCPAGQE